MKIITSLVLKTCLTLILIIIFAVQMFAIGPYAPPFQPYKVPFQNSDLYQIYNAFYTIGATYIPPVADDTIPFQNTDTWQIYNAILSIGGGSVGCVCTHQLSDTINVHNLIIDSIPVGHLTPAYRPLIIDTLTGLVTADTVQVKSSWSLTGNSSTIPSINYIGTIDAVPFQFIENGLWAGGVSDGSYTGGGYGGLYTGLGVGAGRLCNNCNFTAIGYGALSSDASGSNNTAVGQGSLQLNNGGSLNTGIGTNALSANVTGSLLTALGSQANVTVDGITNSTVIGYNSSVSLSNSIVLGNGCNTYIGKGGSGLNGLILSDVTGVCWLVTVSTAGALTTATTTCP